MLGEPNSETVSQFTQFAVEPQVYKRKLYLPQLKRKRTRAKMASRKNAAAAQPRNWKRYGACGAYAQKASSWGVTQ